MKALVTGGAGFIGSSLTEALLALGYAVRVLDNFSTGKRKNLEKVLTHVELFEGDVRSKDLVSRAAQGVDVILHQAALPSVPRSIKYPILSNDVNVCGTINVLDAAIDYRVKRFVYASSSSVYGDTPELPKRETSKTNPMSPYAISKWAGEQYCRLYSRLYGIETICLRYFSVYGPRQDAFSEYSAVIPRFIVAMMLNKQPVVFGDGEQTRDFTHVSDVVQANILALSADTEGGAVINCASGNRITMNQLVAQINHLLGKNIRPVHTQPRAGDILHSVADISLARESLGYLPSVPFHKGLQETIHEIDRD